MLGSPLASPNNRAFRKIEITVPQKGPSASRGSEVPVDCLEWIVENLSHTYRGQNQNMFKGASHSLPLILIKRAPKHMIGGLYIKAGET